MATADRILALKLIADVQDLNKGVGKAEGKLKGMSKSALSWGKALTAGLVVGGIELVTDALGDAWSGFRSGQQVAAQLKTTWDNLGLAGEDYAGTLDKITASTLALGTSDDEAVQVFNDTLKRTGDTEESMKRLAIAQDLAASKGISLNQAMKLVNGAADGNKKSIRELGLTSDTAGGRLDELGKKVKGAAKTKSDMDPLGRLFNRMNEDLEGIVGGLATGDIDTALKSLGDIGTALGDAWNGLAPKITDTLDNLTGGKFSEGVTMIQGLADKILPSLQSAFDATGPFIAAFIGAANNIITALQPVIDIFVGVAGTSLKIALDTISGVLDTLTALLNGDFTGAWNAIQTTVDTVIQDVLDGINGIAPALTTVVSNVADAALKIGQGIVDGIVNTVNSIPQTLVDLIGAGINAIIDMWNKLSFEIPAFDIPEFSIHWKPDTGNGDIDNALAINLGAGPFHLWNATGDLVPNFDHVKIPKLAKGGIALGPTLAMIGEGAHPEAVVPLDGRMGNTYVYNVNVTVSPTADKASIGQEIIKAIQAAERRSGRQWRAA